MRSPFWARYRWHVGYPLDWEAMAAAAALVVGRHDWRAFTPTETEHVGLRRTVLVCRWRVRGDVAWLEIEAQSFLRHMVRSLVGTFVEVGRGRRDLDDLRPAARRGRRARRRDRPPPPHGLFLWRIRYPHAP